MNETELALSKFYNMFSSYIENVIGEKIMVDKRISSEFTEAQEYLESNKTKKPEI